MKGYYLIKLNSQLDSENEIVKFFDVGIKIPSEYIANVEKILTNKHHETVFIDEDIDFKVGDELSYLYNLLLKEKKYCTDFWWAETVINKKYCLKTKLPFMPKEEVERALNYISSDKFKLSPRSSFVFVFRNEKDEKVAITILSEEGNEFKKAHDMSELKAFARSIAIKELENFAADRELQLKLDEHNLEDAFTLNSHENISEDKNSKDKDSGENYDKPYLGLE